MVHERFDIERWTKFFSLGKLRDEARAFVEKRRSDSPESYPDAAAVQRHIKLMNPGGEIVTSPYHLAVVEQIRAEALLGKNLQTIPTDVFVFAKGEPADRCVTKVGGLPYWPHDRPWPVSSKGEPLDFVAQFCFNDSTDLVGKLPADVLLIFANGIYGKDWHANDAGALYFVWARCTGFKPIEAASVPRTRWEIEPVYGELHRTVDYLGAKEVLADTYDQPWCIAVTEGTKIGGAPRWIQNKQNMPGRRFLCALGSIGPTMQLRTDMIRGLHPFTNEPKPFLLPRKSENLLMWGDSGSLFLFLDDTARIYWTIQGY